MWIISLLETLTGFVPRPVIIRPDEGGFRQTPKLWGGTWLIEMKPHKWYWIIPWIMEYETVKTKPQVADIRIQSVWTKDGKDIAIGGAIRYYVNNYMKAQLEVLDYDKTIQTIALTKIFTFVRQHTLEELTVGIDELCDGLLKSIREDSKGWGLKIQEVQLTDIGHTINYRLLFNNSPLEAE
jgi:regulator of protease activity HflC (stomatin/prohibitin superfamily)